MSSRTRYAAQASAGASLLVPNKSRRVLISNEGGEGVNINTMRPLRNTLLTSLLWSQRMPMQNAHVYVGGLLGVRAEVTLYPRDNRAVVCLSGIPVGGKLNGEAKFDDGFQNVSLDPAFASRLSALRVSIGAITPSDDYSKVSVSVKLPAFLGCHTITVHRVAREGDAICVENAASSGAGEASRLGVGNCDQRGLGTAFGRWRLTWLRERSALHPP
jgi:hypothetical protein